MRSSVFSAKARYLQDRTRAQGPHLGEAVDVGDGSPGVGIAILRVRDRRQRIAVFDGPFAAAAVTAGSRVLGRPQARFDDLLKAHVQRGAHGRAVVFEQDEVLGDAGDYREEAERMAPLEEDPWRPA